MRFRIAQVALLVSYLAGSLQAQPHLTSITAVLPVSVPCPVPHGRILGELKVGQVTFAGSPQLPPPVRERIAHRIERRAVGASVESVTQQAVDQAREGWQNNGYFKATAISEGATLNPVPPQTVSLTIRVEEGSRYRLGEVTFKNNRAVQNTKALRALFPIKDGDVFSREEIAKGLENLRQVYMELGYINFTSIPNTTFNEEKKLAFLEIDVDEGMQFYVLSIDIVGVDQATRDEILRDAPLTRGQIYNSRLLGLLITQHPTIFRFAPDDPDRISKQLDVHNGTVAITLDARPCAHD